MKKFSVCDLMDQLNYGSVCYKENILLWFMFFNAFYDF